MVALIGAGCSNGSVDNGNPGAGSSTGTSPGAGGIASAILIGAFAGLMPAVRASRMPPTVALRTV
jgi:putative ABC transport system permease protein